MYWSHIDIEWRFKLESIIEKDKKNFDGLLRPSQNGLESADGIVVPNSFYYSESV